MQISEITLLKTYKISGHIGAVLKLSLPKMLCEAECEKEAAERFSSFYNALAESYEQALSNSLKRYKGAEILAPIRIDVGFDFEKIKKRGREKILIKRCAQIRIPGKVERAISFTDLFDLQLGVFRK